MTRIHWRSSWTGRDPARGRKSKFSGWPQWGPPRDPTHHWEESGVTSLINSPTEGWPINYTLVSRKGNDLLDHLRKNRFPGKETVSAKTRTAKKLAESVRGRWLTETMFIKTPNTVKCPTHRKGTPWGLLFFVLLFKILASLCHCIWEKDSKKEVAQRGKKACTGPEWNQSGGNTQVY